MIRAFHGTKRLFNKFDLSHAGTSGRIDYGHGIYVSDDPEIAARHGAVMQVNIDAHWSDFLDLDRPLRFQRPEVQKKLITALKAASEALRAAGLPGIRLIDYSGSRPVNNYVIFNPDIIEIVR